VKDEILNRRPVIIVNSSGHFMLVIGLCGDNFVVSNPGTNHRFLYNPLVTPKLMGVRRFKKL